MVNRVLSYGGGIGFLLLLLFGRNLVSFVTSTGEWTPAKEAYAVEMTRGNAAIRDLTMQIRKRLVAISRLQIEGQQANEDSVSEPAKRDLQTLRNEMQILMRARDRIHELVTQLEWMQQHSADADTGAKLLVRTRDLIDRLASGTATELHFMEEVMPVVAANELITEKGAQRFMNHLATSSVGKKEANGFDAEEAAFGLLPENPLRASLQTTN